GMREASLQELYGFYLFNRVDGYDYLGNAKLKPESSWNLSLGTDVTIKHVKLNAQAFSYFIQDYMVGAPLKEFSVMTLGAKGVKQFSNLSSAKILELEGGAELSVLKDWQFKTNNTWNYGSDAEGRALPWMAPFKSVNHLTYRWRNYQLSATGIFAAAQNQVSTEFYGETKTPAYQLIHLKMERDFKINEQLISASLGLENL